MALIKCSSCDREISTDAWRCPQCGAGGPGRRRVLVGGTILLGVVGGLWLINGLLSIAQDLKPQQVPLDGEQAAVLRQLLSRDDFWCPELTSAIIQPKDPKQRNVTAVKASCAGATSFGDTKTIVYRVEIQTDTGTSKVSVWQ